MTEDLLDLKGRTAFVTGAGQGVGRQVALHFANHNASAVVVNDFYADRAETVAREVESAGAKAMVTQADVTDFDAMIATAEEAQAEFGAIDILVNNAGNLGTDPNLNLGGPFWDQSPDDWNRSIGVNLFGVDLPPVFVPILMIGQAPRGRVWVGSAASRLRVPENDNSEMNGDGSGCIHAANLRSRLAPPEGCRSAHS